MSILAIDFGLSKIGIAGSDELNIASHPIKSIRNKSDNSHIDEILAIIDDRKPKLILIGLPYKDDGRLKIQDYIEDFHDNLKIKTKTKIEFWNENFTSKEADEILIKKMNVSRKKRKEYQDMLSACLIIDSYIRSLQSHT
ncbi:MAG: Holliday junction resolvase RuvX [Thermodesulfobacteriota bacterium]|nr:Holliday junction resolvase RuvX [Thermodesulfobacteriota bacterium]MEE2975768.1 Holliday junction resolvase RuvX [Thermodesulfobacteriota bacterium]|tara:strand:+ start:9579 stop:9998 length:420 start_codon:yes stop_codon:yes gene_type:complete